jgi:hypothetical protein
MSNWLGQFVSTSKLFYVLLCFNHCFIFFACGLTPPALYPMDLPFLSFAVWGIMGLNPQTSCSGFGLLFEFLE